MNYIGIDIGSTAAKIAVIGDNNFFFVLPTGWSSIETTKQIKKELEDRGVNLDNSYTVSTGYGRAAVDFANKEITEITCHAAGCADTTPNCTVIDVGGQDTKTIQIEGGVVSDFLMNDKCSAGTGKFIEVMANRLGLEIDELFQLAETGQVLPISSLCTVFAESEIINYIGAGRKREDIAAGVIDSVAAKVSTLAGRLPLSDIVWLTGGLSHIDFFAEQIGKKLGKKVAGKENGKFAGAYGAALLAKKNADKEAIK